MINALLINQHSYQFTFMSLLEFDGVHDEDDNFIMMMMILAMIMISKCLLPAIDFAIRYSTRYLDFLSLLVLEPYSESKNPTRWTLPRTHPEQ